MDELADRVRKERLRRDWSVREAARHGKISNTWWQKFEDYQQPLTPSIRDAVAAAFGWSENWASEAGDSLAIQVADLAEQHARVAKRVAALERAASRRRPTSNGQSPTPS